MNRDVPHLLAIGAGERRVLPALGQECGLTRACRQAHPVGDDMIPSSLRASS
jgi:hypothetical protein